MKLSTKIGKIFRGENYRSNATVRRLKTVRANLEAVPGRIEDAWRIFADARAREAYRERLKRLELANLLAPIDPGGAVADPVYLRRW